MVNTLEHLHVCLSEHVTMHIIFSLKHSCALQVLPHRAASMAGISLLISLVAADLET